MQRNEKLHGEALGVIGHGFVNSRDLLRAIRRAGGEASHALDLVLPLFTSNTAETVKLKAKGRLAPGMDADLLVLTRDGLDLRYVIANGRVLMRDGTVEVREKWLETSKRSVSFIGDDHPDVRSSRSRAET